MTSENCCDELCFTELVRCYEEGGYKKAHGWTQSTGQSAPYPYHPPSEYISCKCDNNRNISDIYNEVILNNMM